MKKFFIIIFFLIFFFKNDSHFLEKKLKSLPIQFLMHAGSSITIDKISEIFLKLFNSSEKDSSKVENKYFYTRKFLSNISSSGLMILLFNKLNKEKFKKKDLLLIPLNLFNSILSMLSIYHFSLYDLSRLICSEEKIHLLNHFIYGNSTILMNAFFYELKFNIGNNEVKENFFKKNSSFMKRLNLNEVKVSEIKSKTFATAALCVLKKNFKK